jgi:CTP:molybdopterin cytidylyltransferase MocA
MPVTVLILAPAAAHGAGPLETHLDAVRGALAVRHAARFAEAGADAVVIHRELPDDTPFGARLRRLVRDHGSGGIVVLGAGSLPLATHEDRRAFVEAGRASEPSALANNAFSADTVAISCAAEVLRDLPDELASDNALPRWLAEVAGVPVRDLRARRDLAFDIDTPLDVLLLTDADANADRSGAGHPGGLPSLPDRDIAAVRERLAALRALAQDPAAELLLTGRIAATDLRAIEHGSRARTRVLIEERGLRTAALAAQRGRPNRRPPRSLLGRLLERDGPEHLGDLVADHADGALIDTRVLLAARTGADEAGWPSAEDRYASDLLLAERVADPWLRDLTAAAADAPVPILLGAHTLVGPGAVLALGLPFAAGDGAS